MQIEEAKMIFLLDSWDMGESIHNWEFKKGSALATIRKTYHITAAWYWPGPIRGHRSSEGIPFRTIEQMLEHIGLWISKKHK